MLNGTKLKGYISEANEDSFTLVDSKTKQPAAIAYRDVAKVNYRLSKGAKIAFGIVIGAAGVGAAMLSYFLYKRSNS